LKSKKLSSYMFFFLSYAIVLLVTISSLVVYYSQTTKHLFQESQSQRISLLNQLESNINEKFRYADALMNSVVSDSNLSGIAKGYNDSASYINLMGDMHNIYKPDYFLNFSIYINKTDEIVTDGIHMSAEDFFTYMYHVRNIKYSDFKDKYLLSNKMRTLMPLVSIQTYENDPSQVMPYVQSFPVDSNAKKLGQIMVLLDMKDAANLIARLTASTNSNVYIIDKDGHTVLSTVKAPALATSLWGKIQEGNNFQTHVNGRTLMVTQVTSSENSWRFVMTTPYEVYFWENNGFTFNCLLIFLAYLLIGLVIAHLLAKRSCKPIHEINDVIANNMPLLDNTGKNEFSMIKNTLIQQFDIGRKLNETIKQQQPIVRKAYLVSIIKGLDTNYEEANRKLPSLGVHIKSNKFIILTFSFNTDSLLFMESNRIEEENIALARTLLKDNGAELLTDDQQYFFLDIDRNQFALLINPSKNLSDQDFTQQLQKQLDQFNQKMLEQYKLSIHFGIGKIHEGLESLPKCYEEAKRALSLSEQCDTNEAVRFETIEDKNTDYYFPTDMEFLMVSNLKNGNYHAGRELLKNIFDINQNVKISQRSEDALINDISVALVGVMNCALIAKEQPLVPMDFLRDQFGEDLTIATARDVFVGYINRIEDTSESKTISKTEILVNKISEFIEKNSEGNLLDLNYIARQFDVTPQYVSNIFKKYKHEHIKDFISKCKLEKAKGYLKDTNMPLRNISIQIGYSDEMGIFRLFRKYENMTPGEYRATNKA
jgi:two-component system response regulator YesN